MLASSADRALSAPLAARVGRTLIRKLQELDEGLDATDGSGPGTPGAPAAQVGYASRVTSVT